MDEQGELLPPDHAGVRRVFSRTGRVNAEAIFAARWRRENRRVNCVNGGHTTLEWILCPDGRHRPSPVSRRDAQVAASVIRWLGTSVGSSFLHECLREIGDARYLSETAELQRHRLRAQVDDLRRRILHREGIDL